MLLSRGKGGEAGTGTLSFIFSCYCFKLCLFFHQQDVERFVKVFLSEGKEKKMQIVAKEKLRFLIAMRYKSTERDGKIQLISFFNWFILCAKVRYVSNASRNMSLFTYGGCSSSSS